ncbi:raffinose/stachyose/melibiose transport system substrate-binding protein [Cohnella sp. SGD-V74]|uniref:ABC transporter substrate-binding protein n=1 Tax=unclassified Cohnella TaxID=2636738 RepID=UPI000D4BE97B|nr:MULTISPECIES: extracellular solute-binding protein [unclassified Cohnella]PRX74969.1 raffinose/stachyose/melibiose transport system substrate-binding protein [Cohnella sp. SGD-V74]
MRKRTKAGFAALCLTLSLLVAGCGGGGQNAPEAGASGSSSQPKEENVTLKLYLVNNANLNLEEVHRKFEEKYPNIRLDYEGAPVDQFETVIKTKLASGDAPDIFTVFAGTKKDPFVNAGYLLDLSDEPWVQRLTPGAIRSASKDGKIYGLPRSQNVIGVIYNKKIFKDLGLAVPTDWQSFLDAAHKIKDSGVTPIGLGLKDQFVTQLIPYAMAASAIYRDNPEFDGQMAEGKATFVGSAWEKMMADYVDLEKQGLTNKGVLGTANDQVLQLMSSGKVAMTVSLNAVVPALKAANPELEWGMFPLPYVEAGEPIWVSTGPALFAGAYAKTKHPEAVRKYLDFVASPESMKTILDATQSFSIVDDVTPSLDAALMEIEPSLKVGTYAFLDQNWPAAVQPQMFVGIQGVFAGGSVNDMLAKMDEAYKEGNK